MKLLIIEDEISLKQSIVDFLSAAGYLCESASTYHEAVEKIAKAFKDVGVVSSVKERI